MIASNSLPVLTQISLKKRHFALPNHPHHPIQFHLILHRTAPHHNQSPIIRNSQTEKPPPSKTSSPNTKKNNNMCTQEILWCACGHGEFLPIVKCPQAETVGFCFTVVHGDHRVVLPMKCSYCVSGQAERAALSTNARPEGELAALIEG